MDRSAPPKKSELEISIIGPGRGECILLHLGDNEWCIIDSCISPGRTESVALDYLNDIGVQPSECVKLVVATHWHDDHIRGLASILRRTPNAHFFCSAALDTKIFCELVGAFTVAGQTKSGVDEFASILGAIDASRQPTTRFATPKWANENRRLLYLADDLRSFNAAVTALSPSDNTIGLALAEIAKLLPTSGEPLRSIPPITPNHASVALWVEAGPIRALLGADLLHSRNEGEGWTGVLASHQDNRRAVLFKVPHHGSITADCPDVWNRLLVENPIAVVTPFNSGVPLPKPADLKRLASRTGNLYCTSVGPGQAPRRDAIVERFVRQQVKKRKVVDGKPGHVRVRWSIDNATPSVELFNGAQRARAKKT